VCGVVNDGRERNERGREGRVLLSKNGCTSQSSKRKKTKKKNTHSLPLLDVLKFTQSVIVGGVDIQNGNKEHACSINEQKKQPFSGKKRIEEEGEGHYFSSKKQGKKERETRYKIAGKYTQAKTEPLSLIVFWQHPKSVLK